MAGTLAYVDTSAFVKLVLDEDEADALRTELSAWDGHVASWLLQAEAVRACARYGPSYAQLATDALSTLALVPIDEAILDAAARLQPPTLRTLDAIHLATALSLGPDLGTLFTYDTRMADAAGAAGIRVSTPS